VVWLLQVRTSLGVAPSLATFSRLEVLMKAAIVAAVSLLGSMPFPRAGWRAWPAYGFVAAVLIEMIHGVLLPARAASFGGVVANTAGMSWVPCCSSRSGIHARSGWLLAMSCLHHIDEAFQDGRHFAQALASPGARRHLQPSGESSLSAPFR
jgi:hypothetical protein